jgi:hypothetical protein
MIKIPIVIPLLKVDSEKELTKLELKMIAKKKKMLKKAGVILRYR